MYRQLKDLSLCVKICREIKNEHSNKNVTNVI